MYFTINSTGTPSGGGTINLYVNGIRQQITHIGTTHVQAAAGSIIYWVVQPDSSHVITEYNLNSVDSATPCWRDTIMNTSAAFALVSTQTLIVEFDGYAGTATGPNTGAVPPAQNCAWCDETNGDRCRWIRSSCDYPSHGWCDDCDAFWSRLQEVTVFGQGAMHGKYYVRICGGGGRPDGFRLIYNNCTSSSQAIIPSSSSDSRVQDNSYGSIWAGVKGWDSTPNTCSAADLSYYWNVSAKKFTFEACSKCDGGTLADLWILPDPPGYTPVGQATWWTWYIVDPADAQGTLGTLSFAGHTYSTYTNDPFKDGDCCSPAGTFAHANCTVGINC